jgi:uncharacterized membrane protein
MNLLTKIQLTAVLLFLTSSASAANSVLLCNDMPEQLWGAVRYKNEEGIYQTTGYHVIWPKECIAPFSEPIFGKIWVYGYTRQLTWQGNDDSATFCVIKRHFKFIEHPHPEFIVKADRCVPDGWDNTEEVKFRLIDTGESNSARVTFSAQGLSIQHPIRENMPSGVSNAGRSKRGVKSLPSVDTAGVSNQTSNSSGNRPSAAGSSNQPAKPSMAGGSPAAAGGPCSGNACEDLKIQQRDGCIVLVNRNPDRKIRVEGSNWVPSYIYTVYSGSELVPRTHDNYCHRDWYSKWIANYN